MNTPTTPDMSPVEGHRQAGSPLVGGGLQPFAAWLYEGFWSRNGWAKSTPFVEQSAAIQNMWMGIASDARALLVTSRDAQGERACVRAQIAPEAPNSSSSSEREAIARTPDAETALAIALRRLGVEHVTGHCGEENSEIKARDRHNEAVDVVLAALRAPIPPEPEETGSSSADVALTSLRGLLSRAEEYVSDALDAYEHSEGRDLLNEIKAALAPSIGKGG